MALQQSNPMQEVQRVEVGLEGHSTARRLKICLQSYDDGLGWYTAGSVSIPLHQVPLLEQALEELRAEPATDSPETSKVIPFPGLRVARADG